MLAKTSLARPGFVFFWEGKDRASLVVAVVQGWKAEVPLRVHFLPSPGRS